MKPNFPFLAVAWLAGLGGLHAQAPQPVKYQGRVTVGGADFDGAGQFKFALVSRDGGTSCWSNDGASTGGSEPALAVSVPVSNGQYSVLLGDVTVANMAFLPAAVFTNAELRLRVWFDDGTHGFQWLT